MALISVTYASSPSSDTLIPTLEYNNSAERSAMDLLISLEPHGSN